MSKSPCPHETALRQAKVRPTRQRMALFQLLDELGRAHVTADEMFRRAEERGLHLSLATVYNNLSFFAKAGLLKRIDLGEKAWFCTDPRAHHHFLDVASGRLLDIPDPQPAFDYLPAAPEGYQITGVDVLVRVRPNLARRGRRSESSS